MKQRKLGNSNIAVSEIGYGAMGLTHAYGEPMLGDREKDAIAVIHRAIDLGVTLFDTAEIYGPLTNETLLGKALKGKRDRVVIATKTGFVVEEKSDGTYRRDGRPETIKKAAEGSLRRLGIDVIDLYQLHRVDPEVAIEESVGAMADLVHEGKVRAIGLSETDVPTLERAMRVHPIATLQSELSLWTRDALAEILPWCDTHDVGFLAFSPLGRGFLTGRLSQSEIAPTDFRATLPRFQGENFDRNQRIVREVENVAQRLGVTNGQIALAWVLAQADNVIPIPGTKRIPYLEENVGAADVQLSERDLEELNAIDAAAGTRYAAT
jgi:aryl-alcohol dehydrogenase-like predicted oxidoreductase